MSVVGGVVGVAVLLGLESDGVKWDRCWNYGGHEMGALGVHGDWGRIGVEGVGMLLEMEGSVGTGGVGGYWRGWWVLGGSVGTGGVGGG